MELDTQDLELDLPNFPVPDQPEPSFEEARTEERAQAPQPQAVVGLVEENQPRQEQGEVQRRFEENLRLQRQNRQQLRIFKVPNEGMSDTCSQSSDGEDLNRVIKRCHPPTSNLLVPSHPLVRTTYCAKEAQLSSTTNTESEPEQVAPGMYMKQRKLQVVPNVPCGKIKQRRFVTRSLT